MYIWEFCDGWRMVREIGKVFKICFGDEVEFFYECFFVFLFNFYKRYLIMFIKFNEEIENGDYYE